jgi:hypothetical protein
MDEQLSHAIVIYLESVSRSRTDSMTRLTGAFGDRTAAEIQPRIDAVLHDLMSIKVDWKVHTLQSGTETAVAELRRRHPDLTDAAFKKLSNYFAFNWK